MQAAGEAAAGGPGRPTPLVSRQNGGGPSVARGVGLMAMSAQQVAGSVVHRE